MMKKLIIALALAIVCLSFALAQARSVVYGGGQLILSGGDTKSIGAATFADIGVELNPGLYPRMVAWGQYDATKTGEAIDIDNVAGGITYLTEQLVPKAKMGAFLTVGAGGGKVEGEKSKFSVLSSLGIYFDLKEKTQIQFGVGALNVGDFTTYGLKLGLAIYH